MIKQIVLATSIVATPAFAESPAEKGLRIATEADKYHAGYDDYTADGVMTLEDAGGNKSERRLMTKVLEKDEGDRSLMIFSKPRDIKGTALLTWTAKKGSDDQWLYLPSLKRVKRIASSNKNGPFLGSEFSFEDLTPREVDKYTYKYVKQAKCNKLTCDVIDAFPVDKKSGYKRQRVYIDTEEKRFQKIEFYDRKKSHLKTMTFSQYKKHKKKHWAASKVFMKNLQNKKSTTFLWSNHKYGNGLSDKDFAKSVLKRGR